MPQPASPADDAGPTPDDGLRVALLRSVVIKGRRVDGAGARALAEAAGGTHVRSVIATGNLVFRSALAPSELEHLLEAACAERFGRATEMVVKTAQAWRRLVAANPFGAEAALAPARVLAWAMRSALPDEGLDRLRACAVGAERVERTEDGDFFCWFGEGDIPASRLAGAFGLRSLGAVGTNRNWNTVQRITAAVVALEAVPGRYGGAMR